MKRPLSLVTVIPLFLHSASAQCSICTKGDIQQEANITTSTSNNLANPNAIIPVSLGNLQYAVTCQELNEQLGVLVPSIDTADDLAECQALISQESTMLDVTSYCGCGTNVTSGTDPSQQNTGCSFCSLENTTDPDLVIDFYNFTNQKNNNTLQWTCKDLVSLIPFVKDTGLCQEVQEFMPTCCGANDTTVVVVEVEQTIMTCTLCGATARAPEGKSLAAEPVMVMGFLNRSIPITPMGRTAQLELQTCFEINEALNQDPLIVTDDEDASQACVDQRNSFAMDQDIYLDLSSYCGCPNAPAPKLCEFACTSETNMIHKDMVVHKLPDGTKLTCNDILSAVPYLVDFDVCQDYQKYQSLCCANFEASCHLCSSSSSLALKHPEKIIPSWQRTCGLMDQYFGTVLGVNNNDTDVMRECNDYRTTKNQDAIVDLESYCGCETAVAPKTCQFCTNLINPNLLLRDLVSNQDREVIHKLNDWGIAGNSMTCRAVAELAPIVTNDDFCQDLQYFLPFCCSDFEPTCGMCGSANMTRPDAVLPGKNETCAAADQLYFHTIQNNATACNVQRNTFHTDSMNVVAYCGCPGQDPPHQCNFCNASDLIDSNMVIGTGSEARTCGYLAEMAPFLTNQTLCSWVEFAKAQCCQPNVDEACSICREGAMGRPNNVVEHQTGTTCHELDQTLQQLPRDICAQVKGDWDFDLESFCGCEGAPRMDRCELCGPRQVLRNHSVALPDKPSWTCEMGERQAAFVYSKVVCEMEIQTKANVEVCCEEVATNPSPTSPPLEKGPKIITQSMEDAGLSDAMLWLATVVEVLIILVFLLVRKHELTNVRPVPPSDNNLAPIPETAALI